MNLVDEATERPVPRRSKERADAIVGGKAMAYDEGGGRGHVRWIVRIEVGRT